MTLPAVVSNPVDTNCPPDARAITVAMADGLACEYLQLETGAFAADWQIVALPAFVAQFGDEQIAVARRTEVPADRWAFVVPLSLPHTARWNGVAIRGGELIVCAPGSVGYALDAGGTSIAIVTASRAAAPEVVSAAVRFARDGESRVIRPDRPASATLLEDLLALRASGSRLAASRAARKSFRAAQRIGEGLLRCLRPAEERETLSGHARSRIIASAEEFFRSHGGESISIAQLSAVTAVSERRLRYAFKRVYKTTPKRYFRLFQLHRVRQSLLTATRELTVTTIATSHGFYELGRFAGEYKAIFGELPSHTLQRTRCRASVSSAA